MKVRTDLTCSLTCLSKTAAVYGASAMCLLNLAITREGGDYLYFTWMFKEAP